MKLARIDHNRCDAPLIQQRNERTLILTAREIAEQNTIVLATVGSTIHGLNVPGTDDHDEMGICIEPKEYVIGLKLFEQDVFRTQPEGHRSGPGDVDRTIYSLRKWMRLALKGNPTVQLLLWHPSPKRYGGLFLELQHQASRFISQHMGRAYLGYLTAQKQRLLGERGQKDINRPELVEKYGFDTKYAMHMLRLGYQGLEVLQTGRLSLPMREPERSYLYDVRTGKIELNDILTTVGELEVDLQDLIPTVEPEPDWEWANRFLIHAYESYWGRKK